MKTPARAWCRYFSARHPQQGLRVLSCFPLASGATEETVQVAGKDWTQTLAGIATHPNVERIDTLSTGPVGGIVRLRVHGCPLPRLFSQAEVSPPFPADVRGIHGDLLLIIHEREARTLLRRLRDEGMAPQVLRSGRFEPRDNLTKKQRELLDTAVARGYYTYPRQVSLSALARELGVAKSTLSERLRALERRIMSSAGSPMGPITL